MISARVLPSCRPRKAQQRARAHQEGVPGWGWTRFKMGSSGSCLWGQAHRALFTFLWRRRVESEGRLDKWFLASRTTIVRLFKRKMAVWLCRGVSVSVCFSPPLITPSSLPSPSFSPSYLVAKEGQSRFQLLRTEGCHPPSPLAQAEGIWGSGKDSGLSSMPLPVRAQWDFWTQPP